MKYLLIVISLIFLISCDDENSNPDIQTIFDINNPESIEGCWNYISYDGLEGRKIESKERIIKFNLDGEYEIANEDVIIDKAVYNMTSEFLYLNELDGFKYIEVSESEFKVAYNLDTIEFSRTSCPQLKYNSLNANFEGEINLNINTNYVIFSSGGLRDLNDFEFFIECEGKIDNKNYSLDIFIDNLFEEKGFAEIDLYIDDEYYYLNNEGFIESNDISYSVIDNSEYFDITLDIEHKMFVAEDVKIRVWKSGDLYGVYDKVIVNTVQPKREKLNKSKGIK